MVHAPSLWSLLSMPSMGVEAETLPSSRDLSRRSSDHLRVPYPRAKLMIANSVAPTTLAKVSTSPLDQPRDSLPSCWSATPLWSVSNDLRMVPNDCQSVGERTACKHGCFGSELDGSFVGLWNLSYVGSLRRYISSFCDYEVSKRLMVGF